MTHQTPLQRRHHTFTRAPRPLRAHTPQLVTAFNAAVKSQRRTRCRSDDITACSVSRATSMRHAHPYVLASSRTRRAHLRRLRRLRCARRVLRKSFDMAATAMRHCHAPSAPARPSLITTSHHRSSQRNHGRVARASRRARLPGAHDASYLANIVASSRDASRARTAARSRKVCLTVSVSQIVCFCASRTRCRARPSTSSSAIPRDARRLFESARRLHKCAASALPDAMVLVSATQARMPTQPSSMRGKTPRRPARNNPKARDMCWAGRRPEKHHTTRPLPRVAGTRNSGGKGESNP